MGNDDTNRKSTYLHEQLSIANLKRIVFLSIIFGIVGAFVFLFLFPGGAITTAMHQLLKLPGPGAGIGLVFGPFIIILGLIAYNLTKKPGIIVLTYTVFGITHSILTPIIYPTIDTVGSLGPLPLRIVVVILMGITFELCMYISRDQKTVTRYLISSVISNISLISFYWLIIFPGCKGWVKINAIPILLAITILAALFSGLLLFVIKQLFGKR